MRYRADIDGLRAIAIIFVVLFHNFPDFARGGFIGVDIFFVISGYLITSIIKCELDAGQFSIRYFYERRVWRLLPALNIAIVLTLILGILVLDEVEYKALGLSIFAGLLFSENILLIHQIGYFDWLGYLKPLLHLWSLSIEEQFYLITPIFLIIINRKKILVIPVLFAISLISLSACIIYSQINSTFSFYFTPFRVWEFLAGSLLSYASAKPIGNKFIRPDYQVIAALSLISLSFWGLDSKYAYPGFWAILPVISTVILIQNETSWISRKILSHRSLVYLGSISYPLYLFHWILISFVRISEGSNPSIIIRWIIIFIAAYLSHLTYIYIETPVRKAKQTSVSFGLVVVTLTLSAIGYINSFRGGIIFPDLFFAKTVNAGATDASDNMSYFKAYSFECDSQIFPVSILNYNLNCRQSKKSEPPQIVILGDSHAQMLFPGLAEVYSEKNVVYATTSNPHKTTSAAPLLDHPLFNSVYSNLIKSGHVEVILLNASWMAKKSQLPSTISLQAELDRVAKYLNEFKIKMILVTDVPNFPFSAGRCKYSGRLWAKSDCEMSRKIVDDQFNAYFSDFESVKKENSNVEIINISYDFCDEMKCYMARYGRLLYFDGGHLSIYGSKYVGQKALKILED